MGRHGIIENHQSIDVNEIRRNGAFGGTTIEFPYVSFRIASLTPMRSNHFSVNIQFAKDGRWQSIPVRWTRCHFGGSGLGWNAYADGAWESFITPDFVLVADNASI